MVITRTGLTAEKIIFDKLYVSETGTKIDLSLEIPTIQASRFRDQNTQLQFRLTTAGIDTDLFYNTYKEDQDRLKRDVILKNLPVSYVDISFSFLDSALLRTTPGGHSVYRVGTFDVQHTQEAFESRNIFAFCTRVVEYSRSLQSGDERFLSSTFFPIKESDTIYIPENPEILVMQTALSGPTSLLSRAQEVDPATTELKATAFSQLFPSIKDDRFNFLYFLDLRKS